MDTLFMNSKNSKTSDSYRLLLNLADKINIKKSDKYFALSNYRCKNIKKPYENNKFKIPPLTWNGKFGLHTDRILHQILKIIFKKQGEEADIFNRNIRK